MPHCLSRRAFTSAAISALLTPHIACAQDTDAIRALKGKLNIDSFKAKKAARIASSSQKTIFTIGEDAFLSDEHFEADIELNEDGVLRRLNILSGQALAVLKPTDRRQTALIMPNSTASVRGTGFYVNVAVSKPHDYICCCYGHITFQESSTGDHQALKNTYHNATAIDENGDFITPDMNYPFGHYDDELLLLETAVGRKPH